MRSGAGSMPTYPQSLLLPTSLALVGPPPPKVLGSTMGWRFQETFQPRPVGIATKRLKCHTLPIAILVVNLYCLVYGMGPSPLHR